MLQRRVWPDFSQGRTNANTGKDGGPAGNAGGSKGGGSNKAFVACQAQKCKSALRRCLKQPTCVAFSRHLNTTDDVINADIDADASTDEAGALYACVVKKCLPETPLVDASASAGSEKDTSQSAKGGADGDGGSDGGGGGSSGGGTTAIIAAVLVVVCIAAGAGVFVVYVGRRRAGAPAALQTSYPGNARPGVANPMYTDASNTPAPPGAGQGAFYAAAGLGGSTTSGYMDIAPADDGEEI